MVTGAAGLPGVLVQGERDQGIEPATTPPLVVVGRPAQESSMKADHVKMKSCSIFGKQKMLHIWSMTAGRFKNLFQKGTEATEFREKITYRAFTFKLKHNEIQNL